MDPTPVTVISGATGFLGGELLRRTVARHPNGRAIVIVRPSTRGPAAARIDRVLGARGTNRTSVEIVEADLTSDDLARRIVPLVGDGPVRIVHTAASVRFDLDLDEARTVNVGGTRAMLDLAVALCGSSELIRFGHVSTAFVAGTRSGSVAETIGDGHGFNNTYEQSKWEAERLVESYSDRVPASILRPSIILSSPSTTSSGSGAEWALDIFRRGLLLIVPGHADATFDLVPVDSVAAAILEILDRSPASGSIYHLTSRAPITLAEAMHLAAARLGVRRMPRVVSPAVYPWVIRPILQVGLWGKRRRILKVGKLLRPYLTQHRSYDRANTEAILRTTSVRFPTSSECLDAVLSGIGGTA